MSVVIDGSAGVTTNSGAVYNGISAGTAVASTSGTSIDFTSIPSWVKRITVMFSGVSTNGTSAVIVQLGSGSVTTTGYASGGVQAGGTNTATGLGTTVGLLTGGGTAAANVFTGVMTLVNIGSNLWASQSCGGFENTTFGAACGGKTTLSGTLDRIRITTINGTDTFDAGSINILYE